MNREVNILIVGDWQAAKLATGDAVVTATVEDALRHFDQSHFDLIALACPRRGLFSASDVRSLARRAPLARIVAVTGSWCEGPWRREADLLGGVMIIRSHRWAGWLATNARQLLRRLPAAWSLPSTAGNDELAEYDARNELPPGQGLVAICAADRDAAEAIADTLSLAGYATAWRAPGCEQMIQGAAAYVVEANGWNISVADQIAALRRPSVAAPVVLLLNFPLTTDIQAAQAAGASVVLAKPFTSNEFLGQLEVLLTQQRSAKKTEAA